MLVNAFIQYYVLVLCKKAAILISTNVSLFPILHELMPDFIALPNKTG